MKRQSYLAATHVAGFIDWLATELESVSLFRHQYVDRRKASIWQCSDLFDAFEGYRWNHPGNERLDYDAGDCPRSNAIALDALRRDLLAASGDDARSLLASLDVMAWGGVSARNADWLKTNEQGLAQTLHTVKAALDAGDPQAPVLRDKGLRFNSGMTKVYSLLCEDFLIYDSRVAAALGWLVVKYCKAKHLAWVPAELCFPWAAAKEGVNSAAPKQRNPGNPHLQFKRLRAGHHHALWNLRASWLLSAVLAHPAAADSRFNRVTGPVTPLRALEAACFMIGYDLGTDDGVQEYSDEFAQRILAVAEEDFVEIDADELIGQLDEMIKAARQNNSGRV
ncbi:hypothetical protein [Pseudomonas sp. Irchel 3E13]|uniref:hypothetical protein n=1 Tax=Pseudomonas sp. Irchel 3E13 TaxID=2008975 RepID=UPI002115C857|nr:hypothetical protein [Pseudomonas sp. Irchel 3E13]